MRIHEAEALSKKRSRFDHASDFIDMSDPYLRKQLKIGKCLVPVGQAAEGQLSNDEGVNRDVVLEQLAVECGVSFPKMVDPDRRIGQDHFTFGLLRGMLAILGAAPPR